MSSFTKTLNSSFDKNPIISMKPTKMEQAQTGLTIIQSTNCRQAKRKATKRNGIGNNRIRRSTIEKPNSSIFKANTKTSPRPIQKRRKKILNIEEYNHYNLSQRHIRINNLNINNSNNNKTKLSSKISKAQIMKRKKKDKLSNDYKCDYKEPDTNHVKQILVNTKLIEFSVNNPSTQFLISSISSWLSQGWILPKEKESVYRCKIHKYITCSTLPQCLSYSFKEFLFIPTNNNNKKKDSKRNRNKTPSQERQSSDDDNHEWARNIYNALMMQLSLCQKALLFSMGSDRKNRKKKLVSTIKDCIIGKEGIDWMCNNYMTKSRSIFLSFSNTN